MSPITRAPGGIPSGGQFAPDTHAEPNLALGTEANRFADDGNVRDLDQAATAALQSLAAAGPDKDGEAADKIRTEWQQRRDEILTVRRRQDFTNYARRREEEAFALLSAAALADLRNVADELRTEFPQAAKITLARDYDDGNLAIYVESVQDEQGTDLGEDVVDAAQELVSQHSSRQFARFVDESPVDLAVAAAWNPPRQLGTLLG